MWAAIVAGAAAGLASVPHCTAMCGPLAAYACSGSPGRAGQGWYQLGRFSSYSLLGLIVGALGGAAAVSLPGNWGSTLLSWSLALGLGMAAYRLWRRPGVPLVQLGVAPRHTSESRTGRFVESLRNHPFAIGLATALLPCGALATAVLIAASTGTPWLGAVSMLSFAIVSGVGLIGASWLFERFSRRPAPATGRLLAVVLALGAIVLVLRPMHTHEHGDHHADEPASAHEPHP
ncbi:MAG: sulfite exporter TauE/SafE family protein [Myxococcota bacterium]